MPPTEQLLDTLSGESPLVMCRVGCSNGRVQYHVRVQVSRLRGSWRERVYQARSVLRALRGWARGNGVTVSYLKGYWHQNTYCVLVAKNAPCSCIKHKKKGGHHYRLKKGPRYSRLRMMRPRPRSQRAQPRLAITLHGLRAAQIDEVRRHAYRALYGGH